MGRTADNISLHFVGETPHLECLERFISSNEFAVFTGVLIIANTVFIGYTSNEVMDRTVQDYESRVAHNGAVSRRSEPEWQGTVDFVFSMAFLVELLLRILAYEWRFIFGNERVWNLLDTLLVLTSFLEFVFLGSGLLFTRVQLLLRMVRTLRLVRVFRHFMNFRQLRLMMLAIKSSFVALIWAIMLLFIMIFMFSVIFILAVANHISEAQADDPSVEDLRIFFASMPMTVLSLWMSMSGGLSWWEIERLFLLISPSWALIFALFEAIMLLAMMNIVTGIFVNDAVEMAAMDRELRTQTEKTRIYTLMENLKGMFRDVDTDDSGTISLEELRSYLQDEEVRTLLMMMDIEVPDCVSFFEILDVDGIVGQTTHVKSLEHHCDGRSSKTLGRREARKRTRMFFADVSKGTLSSLLEPCTSAVRSSEAPPVRRPLSEPSMRTRVQKVKSACAVVLVLGVIVFGHCFCLCRCDHRLRPTRLFWRFLTVCSVPRILEEWNTRD